MKNKAFNRLACIEPRHMKISDLTPESKRKVVDTTKYSMDSSGAEYDKSILERCVVAQLAEQYVAEWMEGVCMHGEEDLNDPWTYAFDVLSSHKYYGTRIEVKTHQSGSNYITVNTGHVPPFKGTAGINLRPFIEQKVADLIIFFNTRMIDGGWLIEPFLVSDRDSLVSKEVIVKSKYDGYYINKFLPNVIKNHLNLKFF